MGVPEDINWLKSNESCWGRVFRLIAEHAPVGFRELKQMCGEKDWWSLKSWVGLLRDRGLVEESKDGLVLTSHGEKVFEAMKTTEELESL